MARLTTETETPNLTKRDFTKHGLVGFGIASAGPAMASFFSNPFDVAKTRMQLQNELRFYDRGNMKYKSTVDCLLKTFRSEGVIGIQRGLSISVVREGTKNTFRIGLFHPCLSRLHPSDSIAPMWKRMVAGAFSGSVAAVICNPIEVVKTRMQAQGISGIGIQRGYTGLRDALSRIYKEEGIKVLWRGTTISTVRSVAATSVNLSLFTGIKDYLIAFNLSGDTLRTDAFASCLSSVAAVIVQHPFDLVRTRVYNQPSINGIAVVYRNPVSATQLIFQTEGAIGFYKGFGSHLMRTVPHFMLSFVFMGQMQRLARSLSNPQE